MCDDDLTPPRADLTEDEWLRAEPTAGRAPHPHAPVPATGTEARPTTRPGTGAGLPGRRTVLGGALAAGALGLLTAGPGAGRAHAAGDPTRTAARSAKFPLPTAPDAAGEFTVLVTGDAGTGGAGQLAVMAAAREVARARGVDLAVGLGDNIYENGPESATDSEFTTKFETPNTGVDVPWLMVLGNHDCSGLIPGSGGDPSRGDREVAYAAGSPRWYMPSRYYSVALPDTTPGADPLVEFFALDTNPVASTVTQVDPYYRWNGPYMREQRSWLDRALTASRARWKIVLGHHPYLNNGKHGSAGSYDGFVIGHYTSGIHLKELYEEVVCGRADLILSGHDHTLQVLEPTGRSRGTRQIVCGAAAKTGDGKAHFSHPSAWQNFTDLGFMTLTVSARGLTLDTHTVDPAGRTARTAHSITLTAPLNAPARTH
ncbi:metallophosphoesterase (plasmid) [Streptomyces sp. BI20]|uniref:metallophosphoesterase n=1 Tax=Streptomyces sp. BI20 TaxID=3403460 RepID=UPI003C72D29F